MNQIIKILSYNIHKGFGLGKRKLTLDPMREMLRKLQPDVVFLQEVHGEHAGHRSNIPEYPSVSQFEYLAHELWPHFAYGKNAVYEEGHHGNAILSKFPIVRSENIDVSLSKIERRGILHAELEVPGLAEPLHALCAHLGLFGWDRKTQLLEMAKRIRTRISPSASLIAAGDFNDWRQQAGQILSKKIKIHEAFDSLHGGHARSFPSIFPFLRLDRVYFWGLHAEAAKLINDPHWVGLSDHLALWVEFETKAKAP